MTQSNPSLFNKAMALHWPLTICALIALPVITIALKKIGYAKLKGRLARFSPEPHKSSLHNTERILTRTQTAVSAAASRGPVSGACLSRSLTLWWLLRWQGIDTDVRFGVNKQNTVFRAHAWLEYKGQVINDRPDIACEFMSFDRDNFEEALVRLTISNES